MQIVFLSVCVVAMMLGVANARKSEFIELPGHKIKNDYTSPLPHTYITDVPTEWDWSNVNGTSYITKSLNQHIPQYCGSCWAHGALSALADRIKIARKGRGADVNLAVQYILNCGTKIAGSCEGGSATGTYEFIKKSGYVPYDTCLGYQACSYDSDEKGCANQDWSCTAENTCRTCSTFTSSGGFCAGLSRFPNASIAEYGTVKGVDNIKAEIFARGPIACGINAGPILDYQSGVVSSGLPFVDHIISIVGWVQKDGKDAWKIRNSWGEYWGEMGYVYVEVGHDYLGIESQCSWATLASYTESMPEPCYEDGTNCVPVSN